MKVKVTFADGRVVEAEGSAGEIQALGLWPLPLFDLNQTITKYIPLTSPVPYQPIPPYDPCKITW